MENNENNYTGGPVSNNSGSTGTKAVLSLVFAIIAFVMSFISSLFYPAIIGIVLGIVAIIQGKPGQRTCYSGPCCRYNISGAQCDMSYRVRGACRNGGMHDIAVCELKVILINAVKHAGAAKGVCIYNLRMR